MCGPSKLRLAFCTSLKTIDDLCAFFISMLMYSVSNLRTVEERRKKNTFSLFASTQVQRRTNANLIDGAGSGRGERVSEELKAEVEPRSRKIDSK